MVYINSVYSPGALQWSTVQSDWTALGVSWANAPSVAPPFAGSTPVASGQQFVSLDITEQLRQWLDGGKANFGIALMAVNGGAFSLDAKESKGSAHSAWMDMDVSVAGPPGPIGPAGDPGPQGPGTQFNIVFGVLSPAARSLSVQRPSNAQRPR